MDSAHGRRAGWGDSAGKPRLVAEVGGDEAPLFFGLGVCAIIAGPGAVGVVVVVAPFGLFVSLD